MRSRSARGLVKWTRSRTSKRRSVAVACACAVALHRRRINAHCQSISMNDFTRKETEKSKTSLQTPTKQNEQHRKNTVYRGPCFTSCGFRGSRGACRPDRRFDEPIHSNQSSLYFIGFSQQTLRRWDPAQKRSNNNKQVKHEEIQI